MGGNAVDAIVAAVFCVGTTGMYHSEIGGSGFMLVRSSDRTYETMNFREKAPAAAHRDMYKGNFDSSLYGSLARCASKPLFLSPPIRTRDSKGYKLTLDSGVLGELKGLEYIHKKYGNLE